jgi:hypothetical protein
MKIIQDKPNENSKTYIINAKLTEPYVSLGESKTDLTVRIFADDDDDACAQARQYLEGIGAKPGDVKICECLGFSISMDRGK